MKSTFKKRRRPRSGSSNRASYRRELEKLLKRVLAGDVSLNSAEIKPPSEFPYRKIIE